MPSESQKTPQTGGLCPVCGHLSADSNLFHFGSADYSRCQYCRAYYRPAQHETVSSTAEQPEANQFQDYGSQQRVLLAAQKRLVLWPALLDQIHSHMQLGKLLDVGCGYGDFIRSALACGWQAQGIELSPVMVAACQSAGLEVFPVSESEQQELDAPYDLVTYWNVLDANAQPLKQIKHGYAWLKPGGALWLRVPNGALHAAVLRMAAQGSEKYRRAELSPLGQVLFSPCSVKHLLSSAGLVDVQVFSSPLPHRSKTLRSWYGLSKCVEVLSLRRWVWGTSLLAYGIRPS